MSPSPDWRKTLRLHADMHEEIEGEIEFHIQTRADELVRDGVERTASRQQAEREFGDRRAARAACERIDSGEAKRQRRTEVLDAIWFDARQAFRRLRKDPGYSGLAVATLALGMGAILGIFDVVNTVLLRPFPYVAADHLVRIYETMSNAPNVKGSVSYPTFQDWKNQNATLSDMALTSFPASADFQEKGPAEHITAVQASANLFSLLGVQPLLGRGFVADDDAPNTGPVALLAEPFWRRRFGADSGIIGRTVTLDGKPVTVVGVMPAAVRFPSEGTGAVDLWSSFKVDSATANSRGNHAFVALGRLKSGMTVAQANKDLADVAGRIAASVQGPEAGRSATAILLRDTVVGKVKNTLSVLMGAATLLLLLACANAAALLLGRALARRREVAILAALGAERRRVVQQFLIESALLATGGALGGLVVAAFASRAIVASAGALIPRSAGLSLDYRVVLFFVAITGLTALLFGIVPALHISRTDIQQSLRSSDRNASGGGGQRLRNALVVGQIALALVLLVGAGLLIRTFSALTHTNIGMVTSNVLTAHVPIATSRYRTSEEANIRFFNPLLQRVRSLPGVRDAALISLLPLQVSGNNGNFQVRGKSYATPADVPLAEWRTVSPGYFTLVGTPIRHGREFSVNDGPADEHVIVINEALAKAYFPGEDPIGKVIDFSSPQPNAPPNVIIGVVGNVRQAKLDREPAPELYFPIRQSGGFGLEDMTLVLRGTVDVHSLEGPLLRAVNATAPEQTLYLMATMDDVRLGSVADRALYMRVLLAFASVALAMAVAGIYGVIAYGVAQRTREFGIRLALGADRGRVRRLVIRQGLTLGVIGLGVGVPAALLLARLLASLLYGVGAADPLVFGAVIVTLFSVAFAASYLPSVRATRVSPTIALAAE